VVSNWLRIANGKRTLCFAVNKAHASALLDSFRRQGIAAELLTDQDDETTREEVIPHGLGLATATTSAALFPHWEHRIRGASSLSVIFQPTRRASA